jgi:WD40 repeat protein
LLGGRVCVVYDGTNEIEKYKLIGHTQKIKSVAFHPHGSRLATVAKDNTVRVWETRYGIEVLQIAMGHFERGSRIMFSSDGDALVTISFGYDSRKARIWDAHQSNSEMVINGEAAVGSDPEQKAREPAPPPRIK